MRAETVVNARRRQSRGWVRTRARGFLRGESEGEKRRGYRARTRAISRVTNLYGIVWFIGRKFNNGQPNVPREKGGERAPPPGGKGREELSAVGEIYDAFVWVSASRTKSLSRTIFQRDIRCTNRRFVTRVAARRGGGANSKTLVADGKMECAEGNNFEEVGIHFWVI